MKKYYNKGYYINDGFGDFIIADNPKLATHYYDGYSMNKIERNTHVNSGDDFSMFSRWKDDPDDDINIFSHWKD